MTVRVFNRKRTKEGRAFALLNDKQKEEHKRLYHDFLNSGMTYRGAFDKATEVVMA